VLTHAAQLVFYVLAGFVVVLYQGTGLDALLPSSEDEMPEAARSSESAAPPTPRSQNGDDEPAAVEDAASVDPSSGS
jgi:hypothetical protein